MIEAVGIKKSYGSDKNRTDVLHGIDLKIEKESLVVILGASGSGKSTLLNILSGLERPDEGRILYDGKDISGMTDKALCRFRREKVGFIFQQYYLLGNMTVEKNVRLGADLAGNREYKKVICDVGLGDKMQKYPSELSGGEMQRVAIARALSKSPEVLFLDEPTGALDENTGRQVLDYILKLQGERGFTAVMVTHNENIAQTSDIVVRMNSGKITDVFTNSCRKGAYEIGW